MSRNSNKNLVNFLFETSTLKRLQRTGWQILGGGNRESVAEHSFMVSVISLILAKRLKADIETALIMSMFHDLTEARTGDVYKLADLYTDTDEEKALKDALVPLERLGDIIKQAVDKYKKRQSLEAKIVHDADVFSLCLELKMLMEKGNIHAREWFDANKERLILPDSKKLLKEIKQGNSQDWWKKERALLHKMMK